MLCACHEVIHLASYIEAVIYIHPCNRPCEKHIAAVSTMLEILYYQRTFLKNCNLFGFVLPIKTQIETQVFYMNHAHCDGTRVP